MSSATLHIGDVRDVMGTMADGSVDLILTSPPFLALRSYLPADHPDKAKEIGSEPTPAAFLDTLLGHSRDAIGIDIDERNERLVRERVGMFLADVIDHRANTATTEGAPAA